MAMAMMQEVLCPLCKVPMVRAAGIPGVWQCPRKENHEFTHDPDEDGVPRSRGRSRSKSADEVQAPVRCPRCRAVAKRDDLGYYCDGPDHRSLYRLPKESDPYWLSHLGINQPLADVPQANGLDGATCQMLGSTKKGGGSKSGRRPRKPAKNTRYSPFQ